MLNGAGGIQQYAPRTESHANSTERVGRAIQVRDPLEDLFSSTPPEETNWTGSNWDYAGLFLAEMGHRGSHFDENYGMSGQIQQRAQPPYPSVINNTRTWTSGPTDLAR